MNSGAVISASVNPLGWATSGSALVVHNGLSTSNNQGSLNLTVHDIFAIYGTVKIDASSNPFVRSIEQMHGGFHCDSLILFLIIGSLKLFEDISSFAAISFSTHGPTPLHVVSYFIISLLDLSQTANAITLQGMLSTHDMVIGALDVSVSGLTLDGLHAITDSISVSAST